MSPMWRRGLLFVALAAVAYLTLSASPPSDSGVVEAVDSRAPASRSASSKVAEQVNILELKPRRAPADSKALFASTSWALPPKAVAAAPAPPPTAPPLPFTYVGKRLEDGVWHVYVSRGDQTLIVRERETIDGTYRIDAVKPPQMIVTYLPMDERQTLTIGAGE